MTQPPPPLREMRPISGSGRGNSRNLGFGKGLRGICRIFGEFRGSIGDLGGIGGLGRASLGGLEGVWGI